MTSDSLAEYRSKRDFAVTPEPSGKISRSRSKNPVFMVQKHAARRLHFDFRLELNGVLVSWAVTRGPSADPGEKRLAVRTEDHPVSYADFEGTIPKSEYGGGTVMLWDTGTWEAVGDPAAGLQQGKLSFVLHGERMQGEWTLVLMRGKSQGKRENWLLIKHRDEFASSAADSLTEEFATSVKTGRSMAAISAGAVAGKSSAAGAKKSARHSSRLKQPGFQKPQLATLVAEVPAGNAWLHETKFDGYRCLAAIGSAGARLYTRSGLDWSKKFSVLQESMLALPCRSALLDGEVVADSAGTGSDFSALQQALKKGGMLLYYAFDLLSLDGADLRSLPLEARKQQLQQLLASLPADNRVRYSDDIRGHGEQVLARICEAGGEGVISKRLDAPYRSQRNRDWLKIKCTKRQEFVIGGYSPSDKRGRAFASLLVGSFEQGRLIYRGRVGTGFSQEDLETLGATLRRESRKTSPFEEVPAEVARSACWVSPQLVAETDFTELTADGYIRHGVYKGHRRDKKAQEVKLEKAASAGESTARTTDPAVKVASISISSGTREVFPEAGLSKLDLARYYASAGDTLVAIAGHRPLSLVRCPQGIGKACFYQRHAGNSFPAAVKSLAISEKKGGSKHYLYLTSTAGFVGAVQMGAIEFHLWGCKTDKVEAPDRLVFDLDPDEGLDFAAVRDAAFMLQTLLQHMGLASVPMLTGGKGIHVCVCLRRTISWESLRTFSKMVATLLVERHPDQFVATASKARRKGKIFIDWLRNQRGSTAISPYAVRARPGAPVATPVTWQELEHITSASAFYVSSMAERLQAPCPWLRALQAPQTLSDKVFKTLSEQG